MRNRIDLRKLFQSLEDPAVPAGLTERIMRQVAATSRPAVTPASRPILPFEVPHWARLPLAVSGVAAVLLLIGAAWLAPSSWLGLVDGLQASLFAAVWLLTLAAAVLAESVALLNGAVRVGEVLDLILNTPAATIAITTVTLLCLAGVALLHRLSRGAVQRPQGRSVRVGSLLLALGLCCTGLAFGQPQQEAETAGEDAREEAAAAIEEVREQLDEALEEADERAQGAVVDAIERIEDLERDLAEAEEAGGESGPVVRVDLDNKVAFGSTVRVGRDEVADDITSIGGGIKVDGEVRGDAVAIGGDAKIDGRVTGEVVAFGGNVELGPDAEVLGDIASFGGRVSQRRRSDRARRDIRVRSGAISSGIGMATGSTAGAATGSPESAKDRPSSGRARCSSWSGRSSSSGLLIVLAGLVLLVAPKGVDRVRAATVSDPLIMLVVGFGIEVLVLPALVVASILLAVTVIGIPFAILLWPAALVALALALVLGYTGAAAAAGDWFRNRFQGASGIAAGSFGALALGVLTIQALALVADLLGFLGLPWFFRFMFGFPGFVIWYLAWTIGLGAACMTAFGTSRFGAKAAQTVPPEPPPATDAGGERDAGAGSGDGDTPPVPEPPGEQKE